MKRFYVGFVSSAVAMMIIASCSVEHLATVESVKPPDGGLKSSEMTASPVVQFATAFPTFHIPGSQEYDDLIDSSSSKSDGKLSLSIQELQIGCHPASKAFKIKFSFENLSEAPLVIPAFRWIDDHGDVIPIVTNAENTILPSRKAPQSFVYYAIPTPSSYTTISGYGTVDRIIDFYFPNYVLLATGRDNYALVTPEPARYFIKFLYFNWQDGTEEIWTGIIASNRIEICITE